MEKIFEFLVSLVNAGSVVLINLILNSPDLNYFIDLIDWMYKVDIFVCREVYGEVHPNIWV